MATNTRRAAQRSKTSKSIVRLSKAPTSLTAFDDYVAEKIKEAEPTRPSQPRREATSMTASRRQSGWWRMWHAFRHSWMRSLPGRRNTTYSRRLLLLWLLGPIKMDAWLLKYPVGAHVPAHVDIVPNCRRHWRLNCTLWPSREGGEFLYRGSVKRFGPFTFFRSDTQMHAVSKVTKGTRYVLSIGLAR